MSFKPKPYDDYQIDAKRRELELEYIADAWDEAVCDISQDADRDKRIAQAVVKQDATELGNLVMDVIEKYVTEVYIEPEMERWLSEWYSDQMDDYGDYLYQKRKDEAL